MIAFLRSARRLPALPAVLGLALVLAACGSSGNPRLPAPGELGADKFLFDRGQEALEKHRWLDAREYFRRLIDTYPGSEHRRDAKIGLGDSYLGEGRTDSLILAANEFREFLTFFPLAPKADYAQYRLAICHARQMLSPERDQTATLAALQEAETFLRNYPQSAYRPEVLKMQRQARDRLSEAEYLVGVLYFRLRSYAGAVARFEALLVADPEYSGRDGVYFYLGEAFVKGGDTATARRWYERLMKEFAQSDYLDEARTRVAALKP